MKKILLALLIVSGTLAKAEKKYNEIRTSEHSYKIDASDRINVLAKDTYLKIEEWDKTEVYILATVRFDGKVTDKMQKFLDNFQTEVEKKIEKSLNELTIDTDIDEPNKVKIGSKNIGIQVGFGEDDLKIEYLIKVPSSNFLYIKNTYKEIKMIGSFKAVEIDQYSGDFEGDNFEEIKMALKYGKAKFENIGKAVLNLYEQKIEGKSIEFLSAEAKYSEFEIDQIGVIKVKSYESDYSIGNINSITGDYKYGKIEIENAINNASLTLYEVDIESEIIGTMMINESKYSKINVDEMNRIRLVSSYEDELEVDKLKSLQTLYTKYGKYEIGQLNEQLTLEGYKDDIIINSISKDVTGIRIDGKYVNLKLTTNQIPFTLIANTKYGKVNYNKEQIETKKFIKENSKLELVLASIEQTSNPVRIRIDGYEMDVSLEN